VSDSWPNVLPTTAPLKPVCDYSGELSARNVSVLTGIAQKMKYKPHVVIMPRSLEVGSADQLAANIAGKWRLGPEDLTVVVDLKGNSIGANVGTALANKGIDGVYIQQLAAANLTRHLSYKNDIYSAIRRVMHGVERGYTKGVVSAAGPAQTGVRQLAAAPPSGSGLGSLLGGIFALFFLIAFFVVIVGMRNAKTNTRRISLPKDRDMADDVTAIENLVGQPHERAQVPLKEFAKRVHIKNPLADGDEDIDGELRDGIPAADQGKVPISAAFLKKRTGEFGRSAQVDSSLADEGLTPTKADAQTSFAEASGSSTTATDPSSLAPASGSSTMAADPGSFAETDLPSPAAANQPFFAANDTVEPQQRPRPELEREFQKSLGDYGDQMVATDSSSAQTAAELASVDSSASAELSPRIPPSFLEMPQEHASTLPLLPDSPVLPGPLPMSERPIEPARVPPALPGKGWTLPVSASSLASASAQTPESPAQPVIPAQASATPGLSSPAIDPATLVMPPSPSYNLGFDGGFPDFSKPFTNAQGAEAASAGKNEEQKLCPKCGAERSADFAFCLKCGQMFV
jgi:hypothetical protein